MSYVSDIGMRRDDRPVLERAVATDDAILVFSRVTTTGRRGDVVAFDVPRWSRVDRDALLWQRLTEEREDPGPCRQVEIERTSRPEVAVPPEVEVPVLPVSASSVVGAAGGARELIELSAPHRVSLHPRLTPGALTVVRRDPSDPTTLRDAEVCLISHRYGAWWAVPARVAVAPFTIAADAVTFPAQVGLVVWLVVDGSSGHW